MTEITTTLAKIRAYNPCRDSWKKALAALGGFKGYGPDTPLSFRKIVEIVGVSDAIWCLRSVPEHDRLWRHFAIDCVEQVRHLMEDERHLEALRVARRFALGKATENELMEASRAAYAADLGYDIDDASSGATYTAAYYAADAAVNACAAVDNTNYSIAGSASTRSWQANRLIALCEAGEWTPVPASDKLVK